jgi:hypothetical protein
VARYWPEAEVYDRTQRFEGCAAYIFQKAYLTDGPIQMIHTVARWRDEGRCRLAFDLCDPDFLDPEHERRVLAVLPLFDFAVATTWRIAGWLDKWLPTWVIPDRVDIAEIEQIGRHTPTPARKPRLVWAGYERNAPALDPLLSTIKELDLPLTILAMDRPVSFEEFWRQVMEYDVFLNPRPDVLPFSYKSDNKTLIAWALGMPVARDPAELITACDPHERAIGSRVRYEEVRQKWDVRRSVADWKKLLQAWEG